MTGEHPEVVRWPMKRTEHRRRRLAERLGLRFPRVLDLIARTVWRLPERPRMALTRRFVRIGWEAFNRGDLDAAFMLYDPACESDWDPRFPTVGIESKIHDREERMRVQRRIWDDWGGLVFEPEELIGLGDRLVSVGRMSATGLRSGVPVDTDWAATLTIRGGRVIHERISMDRADEIDALLGGA